MMSQPLSAATNLISIEQRCANLENKINTAPKTHAKWGKTILKYTSVSPTLTLADLQATEGHPLRDKVVAFFGLQNGIDEINKLFPFFERLKSVATEVLDQVSLYSLQSVPTLKNAKSSPVVDVLIEESKFLQIPIQDLEDRPDLSAFNFRLHYLRTHQREVFSKIDLEKPLPASLIPFVPVKTIVKLKNELSPSAFQLLTDGQLQALDFSAFSSQQLTQAIRGSRDDEKTVSHRWSLLSSQQKLIAIRTVSSDILRFVPLEDLPKLPYDQLTANQIKPLFCNFRLNEEQQKQRMATLPSKTLNTIFPKLDSDLLEVLSDEQIRNLEYPKLKPRQISAIFQSGIDEDENDRKKTLIPAGVKIQFAAGEPEPGQSLDFSEEGI